MSMDGTLSSDVSSAFTVSYHIQCLSHLTFFVLSCFLSLATSLVADSYTLYGRTVPCFSQPEVTVGLRGC